jgi:hypothetical protein
MLTLRLDFAVGVTFDLKGTFDTIRGWDFMRLPVWLISFDLGLLDLDGKLSLESWGYLVA